MNYVRITMKRLPVSFGLAIMLSPPLSAGQGFVELYAPGHFGNWYEVAGTRQMRNMLAEAKAWGFTRYGDWFDTLDCTSPFRSDPQYALGNALWERKKTHFLSAQNLGLQTDLLMTPNHVFTDQLRPEWAARAGDRVFGQLICPSVPEARQVILDNCRLLFEDLARTGVHLTAITLAPYDYGGCNCPKCTPWITTFAALSVEIHKIALDHHPDVQLQFIGWWWTKEEHQQFAAWMDKNAPQRAAGIALHIPYGKTAVADALLPKGCRRNAFVHIGYGEQSRPRDIYGHLGPVSAPQRLDQTVRTLKSQGVESILAYSEGVHDDVNKAVLAGVWTGKYAKADDALVAYARRYFGAEAAGAARWATFLAGWGRPFDRNPAAERESFTHLSGAASDWRRRQWELKIELFAENRDIQAGSAWTPERLAHVETFWAVRERLQREIYALGPQRHIFADRFIGLPWYQSWSKSAPSSDSRPAEE